MEAEAIFLSVVGGLFLLMVLTLLVTVYKRDKIINVEMKKLRRTIEANDKLQHLTEDNKEQLLKQYESMERAFNKLEQEKKIEKSDHEINQEYHFHAFYMNGLIMSEKNSYGEMRLSLSKKGVDLIDSFTDFNSIVNYAQSLIDTFPFIKPEADANTDYYGMIWKSPVTIHRFMLSKLFLRIRYLIAEEAEEAEQDTNEQQSEREAPRESINEDSNETTVEEE